MLTQILYIYELKVRLKGSRRYSNSGSSLSVNYGKLQSRIQSLLAELVETASRVLLVCFIILYLIASVVYKWQPQKKSCQCWE